MRKNKNVAALIVNYNMPERADALARHVLAYSPADVFLIDNGSDLTEPANLTNIRIPYNVQTTNGWLLGLKALPRKYYAYWFLITSAEFIDDADILTPMLKFLQDTPGAVGIHPSLTKDSTTAWTHLINRGNKPRRTWMIDNIASLYRAEWLDSIGRFDPKLIYGWGIDLETCYKARQQGRSLWVDDRVQIKKVTDIAYSMKRMNSTADYRRVAARRNTADVFLKKYGKDWESLLLEGNIPDEWL